MENKTTLAEKFFSYTKGDIKDILYCGYRDLKHRITIRMYKEYSDATLSFVTVGIYSDGKEDDLLTGYRIRIGEMKEIDGFNKLKYIQTMKLSDESTNDHFNDWDSVSSIVDNYDSKLSEVIYSLRNVISDVVKEENFSGTSVYDLINIHVRSLYDKDKVYIDCITKD